MSRRKILAAAGVPAVALLIGAATVARSEASATPGWTGKTICAEGAITAAERTAASPARTPLNLSVRPCAGTTPAKLAAARWGLAVYYGGSNLIGPRAYIDAPAIRPFAAGGDTSTRTLGNENLSVGVLGDIQAACIITGPSTRIACARITGTGTIEVEPLPTDDPLVTRTVEVLALQFPDPHCAACVRSTPPAPSDSESASPSAGA